MLNHMPLFSALNDIGYRVIAFDLMGQGGSTGKMNHTRINTMIAMGDLIWNKYTRNLRDYPYKTVIGWGIGGLAGYVEASNDGLDRVILIAPNLFPKKNIGQKKTFPISKITRDMHTSAVYSDENPDPHVDKIHPVSPTLTPHFSMDALVSASIAQDKKIDECARGLVILAQDNNTFIDYDKTVEHFSKNAEHFKQMHVPNALHELDNEREEISNNVINEIQDFLRLTE
jgi:alpha-beta hydrolase superfamily lysophospholipase